MKNIDKALVILQQTKDGNELSPGHLYLTQLAVNSQLSEAGEDAFAKLYDDVASGSYNRPWMYGIEGLTREHDGYIAWRGQVVEHYSFYNDEVGERAAAEKLAGQCRSLEERGYPVNGRTVGTFTPFFDAPAGSPWVGAMLHYYTVFKVGEKCKWLILSLPGHHAVALAAADGDGAGVETRYSHFNDVDFGSYELYHALAREGMTSIGDRVLDTYAGFVAAMEEAGITPEMVNRVLAAEVPPAPTTKQ